MPYKTIKIIDIVNDIHSRKILLPAIQRKFVWSDQQIINLMDSIMQEYPIGTFLFWKVKEATINRQGYSMYDFIDNYHERDKYTNEKVSTSLGSDEEKTIWAVLDGQQRLTALYIALHGSISRKLPKKWWNNDDAFPKKELYFNLHSKFSEEDETSYEFKFLTNEEAEDRNDGRIWYHVKDILQFKHEDLLLRVVVPLNLMQDTLATTNIIKLHDRIVENDKIISYFEVEKESIDDVLDIFVRINSGGTVLSKSDLLFSTIVSHWDNARDEIDKLLAGINRKGQTFSFSTDFVIRCCLYLLDLPIKLKVETFKKESVLEIKNNWNKICEAIRKTIDLLVKFGFNRTNIMSDVAITPIAYYIYNNGKLDNDSISELKKYFIAAQVKQIFSASTNSALANIRIRLQNISFSSFKLSSLSDIKFTSGKTLNFTEEEIDEMLDFVKSPYTFMLLTLLYPDLKYDQTALDQDHMHPYSGFSDKKIKNLSMPDGTIIDSQKIKEWQVMGNTLANLQLLERSENESKNDKPLADWLKEGANQDNTKYLPKNISYELNNFDEFMTKRKELIKSKLIQILL